MSHVLKEKLKQKIKRMILIIALAVVVLYLGIVAVMYFLQSSMVYFPSRTLQLNPGDIGLEFEEVFLTTEDESRIHAWFIPSDPSRGTLLFCHGNGGNISHRLESIKQFHDLGLSVFIFDYHGYGKSEGKPGEEETYQDAEAAWNYLTEKRRINRDSIIIFGRSLGGAVASHLALSHRPKAVILESTFLSVPDIAAHFYPFLPTRLLARISYNTKDIISEIDAPLLIIHSHEDDLIPYGHGQKLYELAGNPKQFLEISGSHNDGFLVSDGVYKSGIDAFLKQYLD